MLKVKIAPTSIDLDPNKAWVQVAYSAASPDPAVPTSGRIRLWKRLGDEPRDRRSALSTGQGDWIAPGEYTDLKRLMPWDPNLQPDPGNPTATHEMTFYIEGVQTSQALGDVKITFKLDPDGEGPAPYVHMDTVQVTVYSVKFAGLWETANPANCVFNHTWKDDPADNCKEVDPRLEPGPVVGNFGTWRQMLYVAETKPEQAAPFYCVDLDLDVQPVALRGLFRCAVYDPASVKLCDTLLPSSTLFPAMLVFSDPVVASPAVTNFSVKAGYDANANGVLDNNEASPIVVFYAPPGAPDANQPRYATIKGINDAQCIAADTSIIGGVDPPITLDMFRHTRSFLSIFYFGNLGTIHPWVTPSLITPVSWDAFANNTQFSEWLSHNSGTNFDPFGQATTTQQYTWTSTSVVSQFFANATPFRLADQMTDPGLPPWIPPSTYYVMSETCSKLKAYYDIHVKAEEIAALSGSDPGTTHPSRWCHFPNEHSDLFTSTNGPGNPPPPPWVAPVTQDIGHAVEYSGGWRAVLEALIAVLEGEDAVVDHDAALAIGRGRVIDPQYSFTTRKVDNSGNYYVDSVQFVCTLADLYDFNLESNLPASDAGDSIETCGN
jgi:hypothetical protein